MNDCLTSEVLTILMINALSWATIFLGTPAVVLMMGFTPVELTGYPLHRNLGASLGEACGMRVPCKHCAEWMASITPKRVLRELMEVLNAG